MSTLHEVLSNALPRSLPGGEAITSQQDTTADSYSAYATDTLGFGPYVDFVAGVRFDRFAADYVQSIAAPAARQD
jgi:outer membrane receptor for monomeric catechols